MKQAIDISSITSDKLNSGAYKKVLPEYYALKDIVENNPWHDNQNVFDHVVSVFAGLEEVLQLHFLIDKERYIIHKYLQKKVGRFTRTELLIVATLLHDIAKKDLLIRDSSKKTQSPGHEVIGATMVSDFVKHFGLDKKSAKQVRKIVHYHGDTNDILTLIIHKGKASYYLDIFTQVVGDITVELLLFMYADMMGSDLKKLNPKEYKNREKAIIDSLKTLISST